MPRPFFICIDTQVQASVRLSTVGGKAGHIATVGMGGGGIPQNPSSLSGPELSFLFLLALIHKCRQHFVEMVHPDHIATAGNVHTDPCCLATRARAALNHHLRGKSCLPAGNGDTVEHLSCAAAEPSKSLTLHCPRTVFKPCIDRGTQVQVTFCGDGPP